MVVLTQAEFADAIRAAKSEAWIEFIEHTGLPKSIPNPYHSEKGVAAPLLPIARTSSRRAIEVEVLWAVAVRDNTLHAFSSIDTRALCGVMKRVVTDINKPVDAASEYCAECFAEYNRLVQTQGSGAEQADNHGIFV